MTYRKAWPGLSIVTGIALVLAACGPASNSGDDDDTGGADGGGNTCTGVETRCDGTTFQTCMGGTFVDSETCNFPAFCNPVAGCQECNPAVGQYCDGDSIYMCNSDGTRGDLVQTCAFESCAGGQCVDPCSAAAMNRSYIGCEYWPVDLDNAVEILGEADPTFQCLFFMNSVQTSMMTCPSAGLGSVSQCDFGNTCPGGGACTNRSVCVLDAQHSPYAVVVSNPDPVMAVNVTLQNSVGTMQTVSVGPGQVSALFPQMMGFTDMSLDYSGISSNAYKLTSDRPIVAYQFNPLNNVNVFSNDASLLIPTPAYDTKYLALIWPTLTRRPNAHDYSGYITVVGSAPGMTMVTVTPAAGVRAGASVTALTAGTPATFMLSQFQVLNLEAVADGDLSGSIIECAPACGVFVGTEASGISQDATGNCCADHIEDQLFPSSTWGKEYAIARTQSRGQSEPDVIRILAQKPDTAITINPPPVSGACGILQPGQFCEIQIGVDTEISSPEPILVAHYLMSIGDPGSGVNPTGDPAISFCVPTEQFRESYTFLVPSQYDMNYVSLVAPAGAVVMLDGTAVGGMTPIGAGAFVGGRQSVAAGQHKLECPQGCGVEVYGYGGAVSYLFAGGLDLEQIVVD